MPASLRKLEKRGRSETEAVHLEIAAAQKQTQESILEDEGRPVSARLRQSEQGLGEEHGA